VKAVQIERFGEPGVMHASEVPVPQLRDNEVLVEVEAASVNRLDILTRSGAYHGGGQPPLVLGNEGSGVIREVGSDVSRFVPGERVLAFGGRPGFYAEYVAVPEERVVRCPRDLDSPSAAALPTAWLSAWYCLRNLAQLASGQRILIYAAASGVGDAAVQISKHLGAEVIAVAGSDDKVSWTRENGADRVINYSNQDVLAETMAITAGEGVEAVLDAVGGRSFAEGLKAVGHGGRVITLANVALQESRIDTRDFYPKNVTIHGFQITNLMQRLGYDPRTDLEQLADLVAEGKFDVHVDRLFALESAAAAHRYLEQRRNRGKVILQPSPASTRSGRSAR
jgi:NADPH2:quinone reductase